MGVSFASSLPGTTLLFQTHSPAYLKDTRQHHLACLPQGSNYLTNIGGGGSYQFESGSDSSTWNEKSPCRSTVPPTTAP